ncbi:MAG: MFS transporter [Anaerolineae bacterium]|nr:MFS transporter [Anaerolineae bacterium]
MSTTVGEPGPTRRWLPVILVARTTLNSSFRIVYPFLPSIARGLDISLAAAGGLVTLRMVAGLTAPFLGPLADRRSRRSIMELALLIFAMAGLLLAGIGTLPAAAVTFALYGLAKILYDPTMHAYVGDTVPYAGRARAIGLVELAWSGAWLIGVPAAGFLIERFGWRAPWAVLFGMGLFSLAITRVGLPLGRRPPGGAEKGRAIAMLFTTWRDLLRRRRVMVLLLTSLLMTAAVEAPFIVYGAWLETDFGLSLSTLGLASMVVGLAEVGGEFGTALLTDRLGKRRSVLFGLVGLSASLLLLPVLAQLGLAAALGGVVLVTLSFEFAIVSLLPLATELVAEARASLLSLNMTAFSLGRILGAVMGGWLWQGQVGAIALNAVAGAVCALLAALLMVWGMVEPQ